MTYRLSDSLLSIRLHMSIFQERPQFPQKGTASILLRPANTMMLESRLIQTGLWMTEENQEQLFT